MRIELPTSGSPTSTAPSTTSSGTGQPSGRSCSCTARRVAPVLAGGRPGTRGTGGCSRSTSRASGAPNVGRRSRVSDLRATVSRFVDEVAGAPVVLVGNSMGGGISMLEGARARGGRGPRALELGLPVDRGSLPAPVVMLGSPLYRLPRVGEWFARQRINEGRGRARSRSGSGSSRTIRRRSSRISCGCTWSSSSATSRTPTRGPRSSRPRAR